MQRDLDSGELIEATCHNFMPVSNVHDRTQPMAQTARRRVILALSVYNNKMRKEYNMNDTTFSKIRFIGYAIPTTPSNLVLIGDPNGPGAVAGTYLGNSDFQTDIQNRIEILKNAVDTAKKQLPVDAGVINLFVIPEFYFHGTLGPYIFQDATSDPIDQIKQKLASTFNGTDYPNWIFVFGSVLTSLILNQDITLNASSTIARNKIVQNLSENWLSTYGPLKGVIFDMLVNFIKVCHSYPCCEVRNRSIIVSNIPIRPPQTEEPVTNLMTTEKYFVSNEDFVLYDPSGKQVITEQMTAYIPIDLSAGDAKQNAFDEYAILRQNCINPDNPIRTTVMDYGIEVCLDHSDTRLRQNIQNEPIVIGGVHVQVIASCGMQIIHPSVAADHSGFVFNCDGQYAFNNTDKGQSVLNDVNCLFANYTYQKNTTYAAHTQLSRVQDQATGGNPNLPTSSNATFYDLDPKEITVIDVSPPAIINDYFAGGAGQLHIYGLNNPYTLYL